MRRRIGPVMTLSIRTSTAMLLLLVVHVWLGAGLLIGGAQYISAPGYDLARAMADSDTWGWLLLGGALASLVAPTLPVWWASGVLHALAAVPLLALALALLANLAHATGWGSPLVYVGPALVHGWVVRGRYLRARALQAMQVPAVLL